MTTNDDDVATSAAATAAEDDATNDDITFDEIYNSLPSLRASLKMNNEPTSTSNTPASPRCRSPDCAGSSSLVAVSGRGRGGREGRGGGRGDDRRRGKTKSSSSNSSSSSSSSGSGSGSSTKKKNEANDETSNDNTRSGGEDEKKMLEETIKNFATKFLTQKLSKNPKPGCCPPDEHTHNSDGTTTRCACGSKDAEEPSTFVPADANTNPTELQQQLEQAPAINVVLLGATGVGKTTWLNKHLTGAFTAVHQPTTGVGVAKLLFPTNYGWVKMNCIDTIGGSESTASSSSSTKNPNQKENNTSSTLMGGLDESYYEALQSIIIMFDVTKPKTYKYAQRVFRELKTIAGIPNKIPRLLVGNKCDANLQDRLITKSKITFPKKPNHAYFDLSLHTKDGIELPFLWIIQQLSALPNVLFLQAPEPPAPSEHGNEEENETASSEASTSSATADESLSSSSSSLSPSTTQTTLEEDHDHTHNHKQGNTNHRGNKPPPPAYSEKEIRDYFWLDDTNEVVV